MGPACQRQSLILENSYFVHTISDEYDFHMKIIALDEICNFLVWVFFNLRLLSVGVRNDGPSTNE
jgi:hypothetical protein